MSPDDEDDAGMMDCEAWHYEYQQFLDYLDGANAAIDEAKEYDNGEL